MEIESLAPDLVLYGGRIHTMDEEGTVVEAVAARNGRIVALGSDSEVTALASPGTDAVRLAGRTVIPGFFDAHCHVVEIGIKLSTVRLDECRSPREMMERVRERAERTPPGEWIVGQGWNDSNFTTRRLPKREDIDPATTEHPVVLMRSFNLDVVNTYALRLAGIDRETPDPEGGKIEHDANGEPNGLLRAGAKQLVRQHLPETTVDDLKVGLREAFTRMQSFGITSVVEPGLYPKEIRAYQSLRRDGELGIRANIMPNWCGFRDDETEEQWECRAKEFGFFSGLGDDWLRLGGLKMALDGGVNPRTATMYEPFEGETECTLYHRLDIDALPDYLKTAQSLGWDVGIHCCGDKAQDLVVDALAGIVRERPGEDTRHSIIHGYFPSSRALRQMSQHRIGVVIQPCFIYWTGDSVVEDVGEGRAQNYIPTRTYLDHGIITVASSDVTSIPSGNPFVGLHSMVTRRTRSGRQIASGEAVSRVEALRAYTSAGTWLTREEKLKGSIEVGKVADMAVLDRDYFSVPEDEILRTQVDLTILDGGVVYRR